MDLNSAKLLNAKSWFWAKLAAFFFFAVAGALLIVSLASLHGVRAEAKAHNAGHAQLFFTSPALTPVSAAHSPAQISPH